MTLIKQNICLYGGYNPNPYRNDGFLFTPYLLYPRDGANICLESSVSYPAQIVFTWTAVSGATEYIVEWSNDASFSGPSLRATITSNTYYVLQLDSDVRIGEVLYWRVFARNGSGYVSEKTKPRKVAFQCPGFGEPDRATNFDVNIIIHGDDYMRCCEQKMWSSEISYICEDQLGRPIANIQSMDWEISTEDGAGEPTIIEEGNDVVIIESCGIDRDTSQIFEIRLTVTFNDIIRGDTFEKTATKKVFLDCHSTVRDQPWARVFDDYPLLSVPNYYDQPLGYMTYEPFVYPTDYHQMVTLVGPVFKVPVRLSGCQNPNLELECCDCFPETLGFQIETEYNTVTGTLVWDGEKFVYDGNINPGTSNVCDQVSLHAELMCDGENFVFSATETCDEECLGDVCSKGVDPESMELAWVAEDCDIFTPISDGTFNLFEIAPGIYQTNSSEICDGTGYYIYVIINLNDSEITVRQTYLDGDELVDEVIFTAPIEPQTCTDDLFVFDFEVTDVEGSPCCIVFQLNGNLCTNGEQFTLDPDPFTFTDCSNPDAVLTEDWIDPEANPVTSATVTLGGNIVGEDSCRCSGVYGDYGINIDYYGLEARVQIPIGCGLKFENGVVSLDFDSLAGHGLKVGETEDGCPYLWVDWREGTDYCCDYGCYCCDYDDLFICVNGEQVLSFGDGETIEGIGPESGGMDGGSP